MKNSEGVPLTVKQRIYNLAMPNAPQHLVKNFRKPVLSHPDKLVNCLKEHYFSKTVSDSPEEINAYLDSPEGMEDMANQSLKRLQGFRKNIIPWLDDAKSLAGAKILEIGCGTGSSTVALAEQGAEVVGVDIDSASLMVARERCALYGVDAEILQANATELSQLFANSQFDFIIYFACLEHMTHEERMDAMKTTWDMLPPDSLWCVIETPNRIWFEDHHTALLPFFMWLPDDLAFKYAKFSPRDSLNSTSSEYTDENFLHFLRKGRGVSYHEFELTMGSAESLQVVSSLRSFTEQRSKVMAYGRKLSRSRNLQYEKFLRKVCPNIHPGFHDAALDLIIKK